MKNKKIYIICLLLALFIINTVLVVTNCYDAIDECVHNFIMRYAGEVATKGMKTITFFGSTMFMVILCTIIFLIFLLKKRKSYAFSTAGILIVSTVINNVIKLIIRRPRPQYITVVEHSFSYPSGHTMASTTLYGFIIYLIIKSNMPKQYKIIYSSVLGLLIFLVGLSRIYLGAHFFSDVFGGMLLSTVILLIFSVIDEKKGLIK